MPLDSCHPLTCHSQHGLEHRSPSEGCLAYSSPVVPAWLGSLPEGMACPLGTAGGGAWAWRCQLFCPVYGSAGFAPYSSLHFAVVDDSVVVVVVDAVVVDDAVVDVDAAVVAAAVDTAAVFAQGVVDVAGQLPGSSNSFSSLCAGR